MPLNDFKLALTFLTRLGPATIVHDSSLANARLWFAPVGAILGAIYLAVIYTLHSIYFTSAWILAWIYICLDVWLTRALHYDGLADMADAFGSGKQGDEFWNIIHDSRLGAFGALALFLALSLQLLAIHDLILKAQWYALFVAPIFGRILCVLFTNLVKARNAKSLSGKVSTKLDLKLFLSYLILNFILLYPLGPHILLFSHFFAALLFYKFIKMARMHGGCNGDFHGALIVTGQCLLVLICSIY